MSPKTVQRFWANGIDQTQQLEAGRANFGSRNTPRSMSPETVLRFRDKDMRKIGSLRHAA